MTLTPLDFAVILLPLIGSIALTIYFKRYTRSVADYLAANRCAGRYLICTASGAVSGGMVYFVSQLEMFSRVGFSHNFWGSLAGILTMMLPIIGLVVYRYRQTKALTFHQFFEIRYSRGVRIYSSFLNVASGLFSFGIQPAVGARLLVYFTGAPEFITVGGFHLQTFIPVMLVLMILSLWMALAGGQITVMVTDFFEGLFSMVCYLVIAIAILTTISMKEVREVMLSGPPGKSYVDPFDINSQPDFNGWYILISVAFSIYIYRGYAWNQGFAASARTPHESKMAGILAGWRSYGNMAMVALISVGAFTVLHHPDFAANQAVVQQNLATIENAQLQTQMTMPLALGTLLGPGIKGAFCAIAIIGIISSQGAQLHGFGSTFLQDVILPVRRWLKRDGDLNPKQHLAWLRGTAVAIGLFACFFSVIYKPVDYLMMLTMLIGALYLGGIGAVVWGGLYWARGTTTGAWFSMITGTVLAVAFNLMQQFWTTLAPWIADKTGPGAIANFLTEHAARCPFNGAVLSVTVAIVCVSGYILVSLFTCKEPHDMDKLLHRGPYADPDASDKATGRFEWRKIIGLDDNHTRGDRVITIGTFAWGAFWKTFSLCVLTYTLTVGFLADSWWFAYATTMSIYMPLVLGVVTTVWFAWGGFRDFKSLVYHLKTAKRDDRDDGQIHDGR